MKNRICRISWGHDCWGSPERDFKYYPTPDFLTNEQVLEFAKEIYDEERRDRSDEIEIDGIPLEHYESKIRKKITPKELKLNKSLADVLNSLSEKSKECVLQVILEMKEEGIL